MTICGKFRKTSIADICFKKSAKYLGVKYDHRLDVSTAFGDYKPKLNFIFFKLYRTLKKSDHRTRYNLWQIFVLPLLRMSISLIGVAESERCKQQSELIIDEMRRTLKKFMLLPRSSPKIIVDSMTNYSSAIIKDLLKYWEGVSEQRTGNKLSLGQFEFGGY